MALRVLARKLRSPATAALQRALSFGVPAAAGSRPLRSRYSQNGAKRAVKDMQDARLILRDMEKRILRDMEKEKQDLEELSRAINNLPRNIILTCGIGGLVITSSLAYIFGGFGGNRALYGDQKHLA